MSEVRRLAYAYSALMRGMLYPGSEGDSIYLPVSCPFGPTQELEAEALREALGLAPWWVCSVDDGNAWLQGFQADADANDDAVASRLYGMLAYMMDALNVGGSVHFRAAAPEGWPFHKTRHYIGGRVRGGGFAGLVAYSVET